MKPISAPEKERWNSKVNSPQRWPEANDFEALATKGFDVRCPDPFTAVRSTLRAQPLHAQYFLLPTRKGAAMLSS
jgi:hypothetical protein